jgi:coenzyme F420 biosynthesis associated uncharacterized protein
VAQAPGIDWQLAARTGIGLVRPGPKVSRAEIEQAVAQLRDCADRAPGLVADVTKLPVADTAPVLVVDRPGLIRLNTDTAAGLFQKIGITQEDPDFAHRISAGAAGAAIGTVLSLLATRILGQFDPYGAEPRLALVVPNIIAVERSLKAVPADFRLWVCLHEQTHQAQFAHAGWLPSYVIGLMKDLVTEDAATGSFIDELPTRLDRLRTARRDQAETSIDVVSRLSGPKAAAIIDSVTAVMSVLEGHADVVMDSVGPQVIPTWAKIRRDFSARRRRTGFASIIGKLFGLDAKLAQYANGAAFCKAVIDTAGMDTLNRVFNSATDMPTLSELHDPDAWLARQNNIRTPFEEQGTRVSEPSSQDELDHPRPRRALTDE